MLYIFVTDLERDQGKNYIHWLSETLVTSIGHDPSGLDKT